MFHRVPFMFKSFIKKYLITFTLCLIVVFSVTVHNIAYAQMAPPTVSSGSVTCDTANDCLPSARDATYDVSFTTTDHTPTSQIQVTFPTGYSVDGAYSSFALLPTSGTITVNGSPVSSVSVNAVSNVLTLTLATPTDLSTGTVTFSVFIHAYSSMYPTNPSTLGTTGVFSIAVTDTNSNTFADTSVPGVTIATAQPISNFAVSGNSSADLESGANPAEYEVSFDTTEAIAGAPSGDTIALTFPSGYSIPQGSISTKAICSQPSCQYGRGSLLAHFGMANGSIQVSSVTGLGNTLTLGLSQSNQEFPPETVSFYLMNESEVMGGSADVSNPTTLGTTGTFSMSVDGGTAVTAPGVTITQAPDHLVFTTQPSCSAENDPENPGDCISGEAFSTQPVVTVEDYTGATDTNYNGNVTIFLGSGQGTLSGTLTEQAVNGVATFTNVNYHAGQDRESFILGANATDGSGQGETGITNGTANSFRSDVVATRFKLTDQKDDSDGTITLPAGGGGYGRSGIFHIIPTDADGNVTDTDYNPSSETFTLKDSNGALLSTHSSPNDTTPTISSSSSIANSISSGGNGFVSITLTKAETLGPITVSDGTISGSSDPVDVVTGNIGGFTVTPSTTTPQAGTPFGITAAAMDRYGNVLNAANTQGQTYTGTVFITTNAATPYSLSPSIYTFKQSDDGTKTFNGLITINNAQTGILITVQDQHYDPDKNPYSIGNSTSLNVSAPAPVASSGGGGGGSVSIGGGATASSPNSAIINNGAISTQSSQVTLTLFTQTGTKMMISNTADFAGAVWEPYTLTKQWTLSSGNGQKTVYVKFMDATGAVSAINQSMITLETLVVQTTPESVTTPTVSTNQTLFSKNLKMGMSDPEVKLLQKYLNAHGFVVAKSGVGSSGHENNYFGALTKKAVSKLQKTNGMTADGVIGSKTRKYLNTQS